MSKDLIIAKKELSELLDKAKGEKIDICAKIYNLVCEVENKAGFIKFFLEYDSKDSSEEYEVEMRFTASEKQKLVASCKGLVSGILDKLFLQNYTEDEFYEYLWASIDNKASFSTNEEKICALYLLWVNIRIPYYRLNDGLKMSNEDYAKYVKDLTPKIKKAFYIANSKFEQRTEGASLLIELIDELPGIEEKSIVLSQILNMIERRTIKSIVSDLAQKK